MIVYNRLRNFLNFWNLKNILTCETDDNRTQYVLASGLTHGTCKEKSDLIFQPPLKIEPLGKSSAKIIACKNGQKYSIGERYAHHCLTAESQNELKVLADNILTPFLPRLLTKCVNPIFAPASGKMF